MARKAKTKKKASNKITKKNKRKTSTLDPNVEMVYEKEVTFMCPQRGLVKQKVKVKRLKSKIFTSLQIVGPVEDSVEDIDESNSEPEGSEE